MSTSAGNTTAPSSSNNDENNKPPTTNSNGKTTETAPSITKTSPSTPPRKSASTKEPTRRCRRSKRVLDQDPIIAPGYGTRKDLLRLTQELGHKLPLSAVEAIMRSRGRGLRGGGAQDDEPAAAATPVSSAWADFMQEEGFGGPKRQAAEEAPPSGTRSSRAKRGKTQEEEDVKPAAVGSTGTRDYVLPEAWSNHTKKKTPVAGGILLQAGTLDATITGRSKVKMDPTLTYHCPIPTRLPLGKVQITRVFTSCNAVHSFATATNGSTYAWGRNESSQLGLGDAVGKNVYVPTELELPAPLIMAGVGKGHSIFLLEDQSLHAVGANKVGQCSVRNYTDVLTNIKPCVVPDGVTVAQIACGEDFTMAVSTEGHLYSCGSSQYGQLGNGETGEYFVTANKLAYANCNILTRRTTFCHAPTEKLHTNNDNSKVVPLPNCDDILIQQVVCGKHHTLVVEAASQERPRIFTFGCGDYGCLGHGVQKDEYFPRLVGLVAKLPLGMEPDQRALIATAGAHCSLFRNKAGHVYYWGKHRQVGEATMRPLLVDVLANNQHQVTQMAAGGQTVYCSTALAQTVAWGQGPHGELGLGKAKSSSKPTFVESLNGIGVLDVAAGYGHSLFVVGSSEKAGADKDMTKAIEELPACQEEDVQALVDRES